MDKNNIPKVNDHFKPGDSSRRDFLISLAFILYSVLAGLTSKLLAFYPPSLFKPKIPPPSEKKTELHPEKTKCAEEKNISSDTLPVEENELTCKEFSAQKPEGEDKYDLGYFWHPDIQNVLDYKEDIERISLQCIREKLRTVKGKEGFGLIGDLDFNEKQAGQIAAKYDKILAEHGLDRVSLIKKNEYEYLHNISYSLGPHLERIKKTYAEVYAVLGDQIGKDFVIEKTHFNNYVLVYRILEKGRTARKIAKKHYAILKRNRCKINTSTAIDQNHDVVYEESDFLAENKIPAVPDIKKPPYRKKQIRASFQKTDLEKKIGDYIHRLRQAGGVSSNEKTAWSVYDLTRQESLVSINGTVPYQSASMIKPFVALAFFCNVKEKKLKYDERHIAKMEAMIRRSSNSATNYFIELTGKTPKRVEKMLKNRFPDIFRETKIVEFIPPDGRTYKNKASAKDYSRFLHALWYDRLPYSHEIKRLMRLPNRDRIYKGAKKIPPGTVVYDKTGTTARLCGNMGILVARDRNGRQYPYILVGIIEKASRTKNLSQWSDSRGDVIRGVSNIVYTEFKKRYDLI
jgi:beta-lactamase class A